jgi:hypothetical protein
MAILSGLHGAYKAQSFERGRCWGHSTSVHIGGSSNVQLCAPCHANPAPNSDIISKVAVEKELKARTVETAKVDLAEDRETYGHHSTRYRKTPLHALRREEGLSMRTRMRGTPSLPITNFLRSKGLLFDWARRLYSPSCGKSPFIRAFLKYHIVISDDRHKSRRFVCTVASLRE